MPDESQIEIPQSFIALFVASGRLKPGASLAVVASRYELCEDMACILVEHAQTMQFNLGITESEVLLRCHQGLLDDISLFPAKESGWVIVRLAELLDWAPPPPLLVEA